MLSILLSGIDYHPQRPLPHASEHFVYILFILISQFIPIVCHPRSFSSSLQLFPLAALAVLVIILVAVAIVALVLVTFLILISILISVPLRRSFY